MQHCCNWNNDVQDVTANHQWQNIVKLAKGQINGRLICRHHWFVNTLGLQKLQVQMLSERRLRFLAHQPSWYLLIPLMTNVQQFNTCALQCKYCVVGILSLIMARTPLNTRRVCCSIIPLCSHIIKIFSSLAKTAQYDFHRHFRLPSEKQEIPLEE